MARNKPSDVINQNLSAMQSQEERLPEGGTSGQPDGTVYRSGSGHESIVEEQDDSPVPPQKKYRVMVGGMITINGMKTILRPGKVIKESDYEIQKLFDQGIQLSEIAVA